MCWLAGRPPLAAVVWEQQGVAVWQKAKGGSDEVMRFTGGVVFRGFTHRVCDEVHQQQTPQQAASASCTCCGRAMAVLCAPSAPAGGSQTAGASRIMAVSAAGSSGPDRRATNVRDERRSLVKRLQKKASL